MTDTAIKANCNNQLMMMDTEEKHSKSSPSNVVSSFAEAATDLLDCPSEQVLSQPQELFDENDYDLLSLFDDTDSTLDGQENGSFKEEEINTISDAQVQVALPTLSDQRKDLSPLPELTTELKPRIRGNARRNRGVPKRRGNLKTNDEQPSSKRYEQKCHQSLNSYFHEQPPQRHLERFSSYPPYQGGRPVVSPTQSLLPSNSIEEDDILSEPAILNLSDTDQSMDYEEVLPFDFDGSTPPTASSLSSHFLNGIDQWQSPLSAPGPLRRVSKRPYASSEPCQTTDNHGTMSFDADSKITNETTGYSFLCRQTSSTAASSVDFLTEASEVSSYSDVLGPVGSVHSRQELEDNSILTEFSPKKRKKETDDTSTTAKEELSFLPVEDGIPVFSLIGKSCDRHLVTGFTIAVVTELETASFTDRDRRGKRIKLPVGYPGMACRHCQGRNGRTGRYFPSSVKTISDSKKSLFAMYKHLSTCKKCPTHVKENLYLLEKKHKEERKLEKQHGSQRTFFKKIWISLHPDKAPKQKNKKKN